VLREEEEDLRNLVLRQWGGGELSLHSVKLLLHSEGLREWGSW
jgi:hypothetical protein